LNYYEKKTYCTFIEDAIVVILPLAWTTVMGDEMAYEWHFRQGKLKVA
jgi:hypothetical protein